LGFIKLEGRFVSKALLAAILKEVIYPFNPNDQHVILESNSELFIQ